MKIAICTLGCKVNQYETQALEGEALRRGHTLVPFDGTADAYVVNTCSVTATGDQKSRQLVRRARRLHPEAVVAVCGCYSQAHPHEARALGADLVTGSRDRAGFLDRLEAVLAEKQTQVAVDDAMKRRVFEELPAGGLEGRTRAMLKAEDGCVNFCSYCIIPYTRGPVRSLPPDRAAAQAARLAADGYREIVLTGIELSSWGRDLAPAPSGASRRDRAPALPQLIEAVCAAAPRCRIRLGSLEPRTITRDFCQTLSGLHNVCPHFHLSLQSGCEKTLKAMNRRYSPQRYLQSVELLREYYVNPGITTDLIVGFPGETEADFLESLAFLETCRFSALHVFPYSPRPGTPAAAMPHQIPREEKHRRVREVQRVARQLHRTYLRSFLGAVLPVLFEEEKEGLWQGHAPNYLLVRAEGVSLHNTIRDVRITRVGPSYLMGEVL